jgi:hypothetical protein
MEISNAKTRGNLDQQVFRESKKRQTHMEDLESPPRSSAEHEYELEMERFQTMVRRGMHPEIAVTAALLYCAEHKMPPPQWLTIETTRLLCEFLGKKRRKGGRSTSPCARYLQDMIVYERWDVVRDTRERQISERENVEALRKIPRVSRELLEEREKMLECAGSDLMEAAVCASKRLQGTRAHAGPEAIKKSYLECNRQMRGRSSSLRYHFFDRRLLNSLGINIDFQRRGKKRPPIYELTV